MQCGLSLFLFEDLTHCLHALSVLCSFYPMYSEYGCVSCHKFFTILVASACLSSLFYTVSFCLVVCHICGQKFKMCLFVLIGLCYFWWHSSSQQIFCTHTVYTNTHTVYDTDIDGQWTLSSRNWSCAVDKINLLIQYEVESQILGERQCLDVLKRQ